MAKKFITDVDVDAPNPEIFRVGEWVLDVFITGDGRLGITVYPHGTGSLDVDAIIKEVEGEGKCVDIIVNKDLSVGHG